MKKLIRFTSASLMLLSLVTFCTRSLADERLRVPPGTRSFDQSIQLAYRETDHFSMLMEKYMAWPDGKLHFIWGVGFEGSITLSENDLLWQYEVFNRGLDKQLRSCGSVELLSDSVGNVLEVKSVAKHRECHSETAYLDSKALRFPFPALPENPIIMGENLPIPRSQGADDKDENLFEEDNRQNIVQGILRINARDYLVTEFKGDTIANYNGEKTRASLEGISLIDITSGFIAESVTKISATIPSDSNGDQSDSIGFLTMIRSQY